MTTKRKGLSERGIMGAVRKILGKSAPKVNAKRSIVNTVNKILGHAKCTSVGKIGIYGVGGIGKTSVLKALIDCHEVKNTFDTIILLTVSRLWTGRNIQDEIARHLLISLAGSEYDDHAATELLTELTSRKFLLLLDDVREQIDLDAIGVPSKNKKSGSKVVLAARDIDICHAMAVDKAIKMEFLSAEESWTLFHDQVGGNFNSFPHIQPLERETQTNVIRQLKFGYDQLNGADAKDCFLFSALYQEGQGIKASELIKHCIQEGFISGHLADACQRGGDIVESLLDADLLETTDDGLTVTMHDVIRDLALWIISTKPEDSQFMVNKGVKVTWPENKELSVLCGAYAGLEKPPPKNEWEKLEKMFLMGNEFSRLNKNANCPHLSMLFLQRNMNLRSIHDSFFEHMPYLQVLNLSQTGIKSLPTSLFKLHKLLVLVLRDCPFLLDLPPEIGNLEHLEVLDLQGTEISKLPTETGTLSALKLLRVSFYGPIDSAEHVDLSAEFLQPETISRLIVLKELGIIVRLGDPRWDNCVEPVIEETVDMKELTNLHFYFPRDDFLDFFVRRNASWNQNCLTKFNFVVGQINNRVVCHLPVEVEFDFDQFDRCLRFLTGDIVPDAVVRVLNRAIAFYLDHHFSVGSLSEFNFKSSGEPNARPTDVLVHGFGVGLCFHNVVMLFEQKHQFGVSGLEFTYALTMCRRVGLQMIPLLILEIPLHQRKKKKGLRNRRIRSSRSNVVFFNHFRNDVVCSDPQLSDTPEGSSLVLVKSRGRERNSGAPSSVDSGEFVRHAPSAASGSDGYRLPLAVVGPQVVSRSNSESVCSPASQLERSAPSVDDTLPPPGLLKYGSFLTLTPRGPLDCKPVGLLGLDALQLLPTLPRGATTFADIKPSRPVAGLATSSAAPDHLTPRLALFPAQGFVDQAAEYLITRGVESRADDLLAAASNTQDLFSCHHKPCVGSLWKLCEVKLDNCEPCGIMVDIPEKCSFCVVLVTHALTATKPTFHREEGSSKEEGNENVDSSKVIRNSTTGLGSSSNHFSALAVDGELD
ncbi:hypothetical protein RJ640_018449 [Escallonia rubra]|uniref:NB-ARC domain-containing protein n=1 Tax=Escallonia rubra TaxID=112253 RepID=A0AA88QY90_9ASTE|nr:hypothetical protein RJ640_018449 [Escallonia rubra]